MYIASNANLMNLKTATLLILAGFFGIISSCKKQETSPLSYGKVYDDFTFIVDTTDNLGNITLGTYLVDTDIISELSAEGFSVNNLTSVKIKEIKLEMVSDTQTLNYFRRVEISLSSPGTGGVVFATRDFPENFENKFVVFPDEGTDLKEYFKENELIFTFSGINDQPIKPQRITMRASFEFTVNASL